LEEHTKRIHPLMKADDTRAMTLSNFQRSAINQTVACLLPHLGHPVNLILQFFPPAIQRSTLNASSGGHRPPLQ
jgi:hypothetical protein